MKNSVKVKLTIGIPSYNRSNNLIRTIRDLIYQVRSIKCQGDIEILISDNCSTDATYDRVRELMLKNNDIIIVYYKNNKNLGYDRNCDQVFKKSRGEFVWLMGDDDALLNSALEKVYKNLILYPLVNVIFVNYDIYNDDFSKIIGRSRCKFDKSKDRSVVVTTHNNYYAITNFSNSFVSSNVVRRESWNMMMKDEYLGTLWIHSHIVRDILLLGDSLVIRESLIKMKGLTLKESRLEKYVEGEYDFYLEAHKNFVAFVSELGGMGYNKLLCKNSIKSLLVETIKQIIINKYTSNMYSVRDLLHTYKWTKKYFKSFFLYWAVLIPVLVSPVFFWKVVFHPFRVVYKYFKTT